MRILAIDPGLAHTGVVLLDSSKPRIMGAWTLTTKAEGPVPSFSVAVERSREMARKLACLTHEIEPVDGVVMEAYRDIAGKLRGARNRWTTPLAIGVMLEIAELFCPEGVSVVFQDPEMVMRRYAGYVATWEAKRSIVAGDELLSNEHTRSAAAHALFLCDNRRARGVR